MYLAHRKLWTESGEERTATTHTHGGERSQRSPPARESYKNVATCEKRPIKEKKVDQPTEKRG